METSEPAGPFDLEQVHGLKLDHAPLASVLMQVRHQDLSRLTGEAGEQLAQALAADLADDYPFFGKQKNTGFAIIGEEVRAAPSSTTTWKLTSDDQQWTASFSPGFVALQTLSYQGRNDFRKRLQTLVGAYESRVRTPPITRVGLRYVNRLAGNDLVDIDKLVRAEMLGPLCAPMAGGFALRHMLSQALYTSSDISVQAQWGKLPAGATFDDSVPALNEESWILDLDAYCSPVRARLEPTEVDGTLVRLADVAYAFFRWSVTTEFLARFGGKP